MGQNLFWTDVIEKGKLEKRVVDI